MRSRTDTKGEEMVAVGDEPGNGAVRWLRWVARIWGGLVLLVVLLVLVGYAWKWVTTGEADPHAAEDYPPVENLPPLLTFVAAVGLGIAWFWEGPGAAITLASQFVTLLVLLVHWPISEGSAHYLIAPYGIWMIVTMPGMLFLASWWRSREPRSQGTGA